MNRLTHRVKPLNPLLPSLSFSPPSRQRPNPPPLLPRLRPRLSHSGPRPTPFPLPEVRATRSRRSGQVRLSIMDLNASPEPDPAAAGAEDYVHIEDPDPNVESLGESFVGVDVARAEDDAVSTGGVESEGLDQGRALPEELSRSVAVLTCDSSAEGGVCYVYLVGTAHVSQESCREVQAVISYLKPEVVFLELCSQRVAVLTPQNLKYAAPLHMFDLPSRSYTCIESKSALGELVPTYGEMVEMWKKKHNLFGILYSWFLAKVASHLEVFPGAEFRVGFEEAMKYGGRVVLGDRPVQITIRRTWDKMPLWHKIKLMYSFFFQAVFLPSQEDLTKMLKEMDDVDMLTLVIQEMSKEFPTLIETLLHERDQYMSSSLFKIASEHSSVVAVVGKGHMSGIKKNWKQPVVMKDLLEVPSEKSLSVLKIVTSFGVAAAGVAIVTGIYFGCKK